MKYYLLIIVLSFTFFGFGLSMILLPELAEAPLWLRVSITTTSIFIVSIVNLTVVQRVIEIIKSNIK